MSSRKSIRCSPDSCARGGSSRADGSAQLEQRSAGHLEQRSAGHLEQRSAGRRLWLLALFLPLAFLFHAGSAFAAGADAELALCEFADISIAAGPGACAAADSGDAAAPEASDQALPAEADAGSRAAPMCDNAAASIAAVPEVPEVDRGQFEPARCDMQHLLSLLRSDERAGSANVISSNGTQKPAPQPLRSQQQRPDAAVASGQPWPMPSAPSLVAFDAPRGLGWQRGHSARIERPPSQR